MKYLFIHPEDRLVGEPWSGEQWDRVFDLGRSGFHAYAEASKSFGCPVGPLSDIRDGFEEVRRVRELMACGFGRLTDEYGLDWWELAGLMVHSDLEAAILLTKFAAGASDKDEVHVSRTGFHARALEEIFGGRLHVYGAGRGRGPRHYGRVIRNFPIRQLVGIFWDKFDSGYQLRGRATRRPARSNEPVVLLPSAYINASRTGVEYAKCLPATKFLLVATRRSGWLQELPSNVSAKWLQSYSSLDKARRKAELHDLLTKWNKLRAELETLQEFRILSRTGRFDDFPQRIARGLEIRDAWCNVLDREPVRAVLCADDSNPNTLMPLLLAETRGIPTVVCHHGALDGRYLFKRIHADVVLSKGSMEQDYLVRVCRLPPERVEIGAPGANAVPRSAQKSPIPNRTIVFFSEPYEAGGGRTREFYEDVLPRLADLALREGGRVIVKLHPFESLAERKRLSAGVLNAQQNSVVRCVSGRLDPALLDESWCAITVLSTVAVECARRGLPCFLCKWLDYSPYGYVEEFIRFGVGLALERPEEIESIPRMVAEYQPSPKVQSDCYEPIRKERLEELLNAGAVPKTKTTTLTR